MYISVSMQINVNSSLQSSTQASSCTWWGSEHNISAEGVRKGGREERREGRKVGRKGGSQLWVKERMKE